MGKILSELLRDGAQAGRQAGSGGHGEQGRWQAELGRVALELIAVSVLSDFPLLRHCVAPQPMRRV